MVPGVAVTPQLIQRLTQRQPAPTLVLPDSSLQGQPPVGGVAPQLLSAIMAQLLKCLVMQQGLSSSLFSRSCRIGLGRTLEQTRRPFWSIYRR